MKLGSQDSPHWPDLLVLGLLFCLAIALQVLGGGYSSEFAHYPDEPAHVVTGLMVRDYLLSGDYLDPLGYAIDYYIHYPKVALGHWPPLFHLTQAIWTILFSASRASLLVFMALLAALLGWSVYLAARREFGEPTALISGTIVLLLPVVQEWSNTVMRETLVGLLAFASVLAFGNYLDTERRRSAIVFGLLASATILTKGNGFALALVPLISILLTRKTSLLKSGEFWLPAVLVVAICGPYSWITFSVVADGWSAPGLEYSLAALPFYAWEIARLGGYVIALLALVGLTTHVAIPAARGDLGGRWAAIGSAVVAFWLFHSIVPAAKEARHLVAIVPCVVMLAAAGIHSLSRMRLGKLSALRREGLVVGATLIVFLAAGDFFVPIKDWHGFGPVAECILERAELEDSVLLVSSDAAGEGGFIVEMALREGRPGHICLRASKVLGTSWWDGSQPIDFFATPSQMMDYLDSVPVGIVVLDTSVPDERRRQYHRLLEETLIEFSERWELLGTHGLTRHGVAHVGVLKVYRLIGHENRALGEIRIDMRHELGQEIKFVGHPSVGHEVAH